MNKFNDFSACSYNLFMIKIILCYTIEKQVSILAEITKKGAMFIILINFFLKKLFNLINNLS